MTALIHQMMDAGGLARRMRPGFQTKDGYRMPGGGGGPVRTNAAYWQESSKRVVVTLLAQDETNIGRSIQVSLDRQINCKFWASP